jgi:hypothetical protein
MKKRSVLTLLLVLLASRAYGEKVTIYSDPPGATVYSGGRNMGTTPLILKYDLKWNACKKQQTQHTELTHVVWLSGVTSGDVEIPLCPQYTKHQFTFARPTGVPGIDLDAQYAMQLEAQRAAQTAADRQAYRDWSAQFGAQQQQARERALAYFLTPRPVVVTPPTAWHCSTVVVGQVAQTNCSAW